MVSVINPLSLLLEQNTFGSFAEFDFSSRKHHYGCGLDISSLAALTGAVFLNTVQKKTSLLVVMQDARRAEMLAKDVGNWLGDESVLYFPGLDLKPYEWRLPFGQILEMRLMCFQKLLKGYKCVVVTTLPALLHKLNSPEFIRREILTLSKGQEIDLQDMRETLIHMGFIEECMVEDMGQFSIRGGILDIYPYLVENPLRFEFWGENIDTIREFDIFSQRSIKEIENVEILPVDEASYSKFEIEEGLLAMEGKFSGSEAFTLEHQRLIERRDRTGLPWQKPFFAPNNFSLLDFFHDIPLTVIENKEKMPSSIHQLAAKFDMEYEEACAKGFNVAIPQELIFNEAELLDRLKNNPVLFTGSLSIDAPGYHTFDIVTQSGGGGNLNSIQETLLELERQNYRIYLLSPNKGQAERLKRLTADLPVTDVLVGTLSSGFISRTDCVALFTDHQIFNRFSQSATMRKYRGGGVAIPNFEALNRYDLVVHQDYGIGRYLGIKRIKVDNHAVDCILLQYRGNNKLTIPVSELRKIQKYASRESAAPNLSRLGGKSWDQMKSRARKSIIKLAKDLIELYAKRSTMKGFAFSSDSGMQKEFDEAFIYKPTPDQDKAIHDTKADMEKPIPMDRLICGDVGFGKTEVAMRAAFKAVLDKKQVAVLAPTTLLVSQHFASFQERFANWPVNIEFLNRFRSTSEEREILSDTAGGRVDILLGTHRILSKDISFKNLGLIVVDEEQKFGVKQKEKLKKTRAEVDVLSLSATPIPRSLHMSLVGARDFSVIVTPPRNRLPIETRVIQYDDKIIREALEREISRGGQCYFIHNRVSNLPEITTQVERLFPEARVGMAHGQMHEKDLEQVMIAFINREYDILVSTSIIESGIDLPNVNTLVINNAHHFGLSQLFQMRGRVGRSSIQAFCLLIAPDEEKFSDEAKKRLYSLQKFTELGSGYKLAMRDLEIRGAGNILGTQQSGHINAVGYDTYCRILKDVVQELQKGQAPQLLDPEIDFSENAYIPEDYVEDGIQRIGLYQKISRCYEIGEVEEIREELKDRFGPVPGQAQVLLDIMKTRLALQKLGFSKAILRENLLLLTYSEAHQPNLANISQTVAHFSLKYKLLNEMPLQISISLPDGTRQAQIQRVVEELCNLIHNSR